jgi:hypothetical protein
MVQESHRSQRVLAVFAVGTPARDRRLGAPAELTVTFVHWAPLLAFTHDIQIKKFAEVMAKGGDERGVLPARAVMGTTKTIDATVWPPLRNHVALKFVEGVQCHFQRVAVQTSGLGVVVSFAGWQVAHRFGEPVEQPLSQRPHLHVEREPIENSFRKLFH